MIASTSPFEHGEFTGTVIYTISAPSYSFSNLTLWLPWIPKDERRTSRHIPFYRALFDQDFPQPIAPRKITPRIPKWMPNMGRVRIDRTSL